MLRQDHGGFIDGLLDAAGAERALEGAAQTDVVDLAAARASLQQALLRIRVAERRHREGPRHRG